MTRATLGIAICTFRRASVHAAVASVAGQAVPGLAPPVILVADNDDTAAAREAILGGAGAARGRLAYVHAPGRNVSLARNAALRAARERGVTHLAFLDDDETAGEGWLDALWARMEESGAQAVLGPVDAVYDAQAPGWMRALRPHDTRPAGRPGAPLRTGYGGNVLIHVAHPVFAGAEFDPAFGREGGEDTAFFAAAVARGAVLAYAPAARAAEAVPPERATLSWLLRRRLRAGQTHAQVLLAAPLRRPRAAEAALALGKLAVCAAAAAALAPAPARRNAWLLRGALHAGALSVLAGRAAPGRGGGGPGSPAAGLRPALTEDAP